jgi:hypothetical protein
MANSFPGAEQAAEKGRALSQVPKNIPQGAEARFDFAEFMYGLKLVPFTEGSFSAACEAPGSLRSAGTAQAVPFQSWRIREFGAAAKVGGF